MIRISKTYLPPLEQYSKYLQEIWQSGWVTNNGKYALELEKKLEKFMGVNHVQLVSSGTIALQFAIRALELNEEIITTPFSYVATTSSILWEHCKPVFVDIEPDTLNINYKLIEKAITSSTNAILATHVFGNPCNVEAIKEIAEKYQLKIIYDAAHAFGVEYKDKSLLSYGDVSAVSFHATKLFHTVEGGGIITASDELAEKFFLMKTFGHRGNDHLSIGINGKNSELHAAVGLCILPKIKEFIQKREKKSELYKKLLENSGIKYPSVPENVKYNYAYFPVIFKNQKDMFKAVKALNAEEIYPRRYFYPSLNNLKYIVNEIDCPVSESIASRILCLPFFEELSEKDIEKISTIITKSLKS